MQRAVPRRASDSEAYSHCFLLQTFEKAAEGEEEDYDVSSDEKSPLVKSFTESSLFRRKSTRGSSFAASDKGNDQKEKEKPEEVSSTEETSCI